LVTPQTWLIFLAISEDRIKSVNGKTGTATELYDMLRSKDQDWDFSRDFLKCPATFWVG